MHVREKNTNVSYEANVEAGHDKPRGEERERVIWCKTHIG